MADLQTLSSHMLGEIDPDNIDLSRYGLLTLPFSLQPDPHFMYLSQLCRLVLARTTFAIQNRQGLATIYGMPGVGKTTLAGWLEDRYRKRANYLTAYIEDPPKSNRSTQPLLWRVATEFGLPTRRSKETQMAELRAMLATAQDKKQNVLLIIDEAHTLRAPQFVLLREILNFENRKHGKAIQIVLLGLPELRRRLEAQAALFSRVATFATLEPLTLEDTREMIIFRLLVAGRREPLYTDEAITAIYSVSRGIPRDVCNLARELLLEAYFQDLPMVDLAHVRQFLTLRYPEGLELVANL